MQKIFRKIKNLICYFLFESEKAFFYVIFAILVALFCFMAISMVIAYNSENGDTNTMADNKQEIQPMDDIELSFNDGDLYISKGDSISLDFEKIEFEDKYFENEYDIILPDDYLNYFKERNFSVDDDFIDSVFVTNNKYNKTVITVTEKDVFGIKTFENENELQISFLPPKDVYDKIIVLDAGHGGRDFGKTFGSVYEKDIVLDICKKVEKFFLNSSKVKVYLTRENDVYSEQNTRLFMAKQFADYFLSVHLCSLGGGDVSVNRQIFYSTNDTDTPQDMAIKNVSTLKDSLEKITGLGNFDIVKTEKIGIKNFRVPTGYLSIKFSDDSKFSDKVAKGIADGITKLISE